MERVQRITTMEKIAVFGLGYVGLPLAVEFGKQFVTFGFDINTNRVAELKSGHDSTLEVPDNELSQSEHLTFTDNLHDVAECTIFIVTVPTPIAPTNVQT